MYWYVDLCPTPVVMVPPCKLKSWPDAPLTIARALLVFDLRTSNPTSLPVTYVAMRMEFAVANVVGTYTLITVQPVPSWYGRQDDAARLLSYQCAENVALGAFASAASALGTAT